MRSSRLTLLAACLLAPLAAQVLAPPAAHARTTVGAVNTNFRWLGPDDKIVVERYDDPEVKGVSCYVSRAETGGMKGFVGLATDPSRFSIACRAVAAVVVPPNLPEKHLVFSASASPIFKALRMYRIVDRQKQVLVYLVVSTKLVHGSPYNSLSAVAYGPR